MSYCLTAEQEALKKEVRKLAREKIAPRAAEIDRTGEYPWDIVEIMSRAGFMGLAVPEEYGGGGADLLTCCVVGEEIAKVCGSSSLIFTVQKLSSYPIILGGSPEVKAKYLPDVASGKKLACFGLTERDAGSDAGATQTRARREGGKYIIEGEKCFITSGGVSEINSIFAMTDKKKGVRGISAFLVEKGFPGFSTGKIEDKMGMRGAQVSELVMQDCEVPAGNLLGKEGDGFKIAMQTLDNSRPMVGAQAVGLAQGAMDFAVDWAKQRNQFGRPIAELQGLAFMLAEMAVEIESARQLVYRAAVAGDNHEPNLSVFSAMAKMKASDVAMRVTTDAVQILGGYGYMRELPVERMMRDAKVTQIYEGTNQVQRVVISRALLR